jgi:hypothetical protein
VSCGGVGGFGCFCQGFKVGSQYCDDFVQEFFFMHGRSFSQ